MLTKPPKPIHLDYQRLSLRELTFFLQTRYANLFSSVTPDTGYFTGSTPETLV